MFACTAAGAAMSRVLKQVVVPIFSEAACKKHVGELFKPRFLCAGGEAGKAACHGDSGGQLACFVKQGNGGKWFQKGIVSHGKSCGEKDYPTVYTSVFALTDWITDKTGSECRLSARVYQAASHAKNKNAVYCCRYIAWSVSIGMC